MASNISQNIVPSLWSSANDNVEFEFSFNRYLITDTTSETLALNLSADIVAPNDI